MPNGPTSRAHLLSHPQWLSAARARRHGRGCSTPSRSGGLRRCRRAAAAPAGASTPAKTCWCHCVAATLATLSLQRNPYRYACYAAILGMRDTRGGWPRSLAVSNVRPTRCAPRRFKRLHVWDSSACIPLEKAAGQRNVNVGIAQTSRASGATSLTRRRRPRGTC